MMLRSQADRVVGKRRQDDFKADAGGGCARGGGVAGDVCMLLTRKVSACAGGFLSQRSSLSPCTCTTFVCVQPLYVYNLCTCTTFVRVQPLHVYNLCTCARHARRGRTKAMRAGAWRCLPMGPICGGAALPCTTTSCPPFTPPSTPPSATNLKRSRQDAGILALPVRQRLGAKYVLQAPCPALKSAVPSEHLPAL
eukprot:362607-Chlamydomonas_euryale.AAC.27